MTAMLVRGAVALDEPALARIFRDASLADAGDRDALLAHPEARSFRAGVLAGSRTRVATVADGTVVGFVTAQPPLPPGSSTTTLDAATAHSVDAHPSAAWHQPEGRVHLGAGEGVGQDVERQPDLPLAGGTGPQRR